MTNTNVTDKSFIAKPKLCITLEEGCSASLIELYLTAQKSVTNHSCTHAITDIDLKPQAKLNHVIVQNLSFDNLHIGNIVVAQDRDSQYKSSAILFGGKVNRLSLKIHLNNLNALAEFRALEIARANQHLDIHLTIHHHKPHCKSETLSRAIANDKARAIFTGKIIIDKNAIKTEAKLENKNLLLSKQAEIDSSPQLEVYNDDVKCSHGATVGHLDLEAIFYLKTRGIPETEAKKMLIIAFIHKTLENIENKTLLHYIENIIHEY